MFNKDRKFLYIHVPKTGGTSIESQSDTFRMRCTLGMQKHSLLSEYKREISPEDWNNVFKFTSIRNPYDRFYSYFQKHVLRKRLLSVGAKLDKNGNYTLTKDKSARGANLKLKDINNSYFNNWVIENYSNLRVQKIEGKDITDLRKVNRDIYHHYLIDDKGVIDIDYFVLFENLTPDYNKMSNLISDLRGENFKKIKEHRKNPKRDETFSYNRYWPESIKIFNDLNHRDIELYSRIYQKKTGSKFKGPK